MIQESNWHRRFSLLSEREFRGYRQMERTPERSKEKSVRTTRDLKIGRKYEAVILLHLAVIKMVRSQRPRK